jgi:glutathione synthase
MPLKIAVQSDPIELFNIEGDSTFAMMLAAQGRGHCLFIYHVKSLAYEGSTLSAEGCDVKVHDVKGAHFELGSLRRIDLSTQDAIFMRQDPPFDMGYITATHLLDLIHPKTLVVNDPAEVRNAPEKLFILKFPELMPPTLITRDVKELEKFRQHHNDVILKPLYGNGGAGVFRTHKADQNFSSVLEMFAQLYGTEPFIAQQYLPDVRKGDKRIILVDGKVAGAINRIPAESDNRSNMHVGGLAAPTSMTKREHEICEAIGPELKKRGLIFTGIDVIGDYMTEINVTSPTGIRQVKRFGGADIAELIMNAIEAKR